MNKIWNLNIVKSYRGEKDETIYDECFATKVSAELTASRFIDEMRKKYAKPNGVYAHIFSDQQTITVHDENTGNPLVIFILTVKEHPLHEINAYDERKGLVPPTEL